MNSVALAVSRPMRNSVPKVSGSPYSGDGRVRIRHREYIGDVSGSVAFGLLSYSINPGLSHVFPWLAGIARRFESYLFRRLNFEYETQKSASTSGSVMLAVDFDAADPPPVGKQQLMSYHNAVRSAVWDECCYRSDALDLSKFGVQRYIRTGNLSPNQDVKTYDVGNLYLGTQGEADTSPIGELYVDYDVELITPQTGDDAPASVRIVTSSASRVAPFTGSQTVYGDLSVTATSTTVTFNEIGSFLVNVDCLGTVATAVGPTVTGTATSTAISVQMNNSSDTRFVNSYEVVTTASGQTMIFDFTSSCTTLTTSVVRVAYYSSD